MGNLKSKFIKEKDIEEDDKKSDDAKENNDDKKRNEVRKVLKLKFEKKIAKYIPPKIIFKGNVSKRSLISRKTFKAKYGASNLILFNNYIVLTEESVLYFYNKIFKMIFSKNIVDKNKEEILI